jgi:hypothetical protein
MGWVAWQLLLVATPAGALAAFEESCAYRWYYGVRPPIVM